MQPTTYADYDEDGLQPYAEDASYVAPAWRIADWGIPEWFVVSQTLLPAILMFPGTQGLRFLVRLSSFMVPVAILAYMVVLRNMPLGRHPAQPWLIASLAYLSLMIAHPTTNSLLGGGAQVVLYFCVVSPLFWAPSLIRTPEHLRRIIVLLLVTNGVNAAVGVLQVYDPDTWMPGELSRIVTQSQHGLSAVSYIGAEGQRIIRPPGLFDTPGAVAGPGMFAGLLGAVFAASQIPKLYRLLSAVFAMAGIMAIYLSQVRVSLVLLVGMLALYLVVLVLQRRRASAAAFSTMLVVIVGGGLSMAVSLGGAAIMNRVTTLLEGDPFELYYASRGGQVAYAFGDVADAPFGSGLGRWGMTSAYFFDESNLDAPSMWAEIQINGWLIDGGLILLATYSLALIVTALHDWRVTRYADDDWVRASGAVVLAANMGTVLLCFTFVPFLTGVGVQFWFLAGSLHGVAEGARDFDT
jgi:hypothetical protein